MKRYNIFKNIIIALLAASFYFYSCMTIENEMFPVIIGTITMFGCVYLLLWDLDSRLFVKKKKAGAENELNKCRSVN